MLDNIKNKKLISRCRFESKLIKEHIMKKNLLIAFLGISNIIIAQVGINTTNPTAMFHVFGTTTPGTGPFAFSLEEGTQANGRVLPSVAKGNGSGQ